jgi:hypothetical protein
LRKVGKITPAGEALKEEGCKLKEEIGHLKKQLGN